MKAPRRRGWVPWAVYAVASLLVLEVVGWASWRIVAGERAQRAAEAEAVADQRLRLALWRMDSLVVPLLVLESSRARPAPAVDPADPVRLRARLDAEGMLSALGTGPDADLASAARRARDTESLARLVDIESVRSAARSSLETRAAYGGGEVSAELSGEALSGVEPRSESLGSRQRAAGRALLAASGSEPVGVFRALWAEDELVLVRGVAGDPVRAELVWLDWPRLRGTLLAEAAPLLPGLGLEPRPAGEPIGANDLATIPVRAVAPGVAVDARVNPATVVSLAATWAAVLAGLAAIGVVLFLSRRLAEQRWRFAAAVTHELRTPLTALRLNTELLERSSDDVVRTRRTAAVARDARRLSSVVESVLAFARLGSAASDPGRFAAVSRAVEAAVRAAGPVADEVGVSVEVGVLPDEVAAIDGSALERIVGNLLENAVRHARGRVVVSAAVDGGVARILVEDDGPGVSVGDRGRVFRAFSRGPASGLAGGSGVGLGLALARELARSAGGGVRLAPAVSGGLGGARFEVEVPIWSGG